MVVSSERSLSSLSESEILERGIQILKQIVPDAWEVKLEDGPDGSVGKRGDAMLSIAVAKQHHLRTIVDARRSFAPRDVGTVLGGKKALLQRVQGELPFMVVAPSLSDRARALLAENGYNFLDLAGNVRISSNFPPIYIDRVSGTKTGYPRQRAAAGIRGDKAGRIVRLLADVMPPYGIVELAAAAGVTPGYVSKVAELLEREAIIGRTPRGGIESVDWRELLRLRAQAYAVLETNAVTRYVSPNGPAFALECARDIRLQGAACTGSFAAAALAPVAASTTLMLYVTRDEQALIDQARLLPADEGANVFLLRPYDEVVLQRLYQPGPLKSTIPAVACAQAALDCLTGLGRMPAEGEALMDWMAINEDKWRRPNLAAALDPRNA
jgi:hypothetical protein